MQVDDAPGNRQAQAAVGHRAGAGHAFGAVVAVEEPRYFFGGDAFAGIAHGHIGAVVVAAERDRHRSAGRRVP